MSHAATIALDANEVRKDFGLTMIFGIEGVPHGPGCLIRGSNGAYIDQAVERAWLGYLACASSKHALLQRFAHDRFIGNGDRTEVRAILIRHIIDGNVSDDASIDTLIRAVLKHFGGMPA